MSSWTVIWLSAAALFIILEIITLGLTSIWFAGGAVVAAILASFDVNWLIQLIVFAVSSLVLFIVLRPLFSKHLMKNVEKTNIDSYIGMVGIVSIDINNLKGEGQVKLDGKEWTARNADNDEIIEKNSEVVVKSISGVKLMVCKK